MLSGQKLSVRLVWHEHRHSVELCCCFVLDSSYRIFNCAHCAQQVILCRECDRGNISVSGAVRCFGAKNRCVKPAIATLKDSPVSAMRRLGKLVCANAGPL
jgi:hypothetical protein